MPSDPQLLRPPCVLYEDAHLLVVNKPAGLNTHAPDPFAGEGLYDWLRHREPRWADLAIIHRLDKETSGVLVFGRTALANRSLTEQFTRRTVKKKYLLLTDRPVKDGEFTVRSRMVRVGERYASGAKGDTAETIFRRVEAALTVRNSTLVEAEPRTGRTHQIRVHAADSGMAILGDRLYGGSPFARVCLHAAGISLQHPASGEVISFSAPVDFSTDSRILLRMGLIDSRETNAFRLIHGASDHQAGCFVDRLADFVLFQSEQPPTAEHLLSSLPLPAAIGVYHKAISRSVQKSRPVEASPRRIQGEPAPDRFVIMENGMRFELSFKEGYSIGLFLDQRDNRRRLLTGHVASGFPPLVDRPDVLNAFAYTCGFSVCAARAGGRTVSIDLSRKYLEWGKRNFELNRIDPAGHEFIYGDVSDWLRRLAKKGRTFDLLLLDPPTFSQSKDHGPFRVEKDYHRLITAALPLLRQGGILFASTNAAGWSPEKFVAVVEETVQAARRTILHRHYAPQPPDFPISRLEPGHLKTLWLQIA